MNKKVFLVIMGMVMLIGAQAQQNGYKCRYCADYNKWMLLNLSGLLYINPVLGYKGERFFGDWMKGALHYENGDSVFGADLRYEKYLDEVLFMNDEFKTGILPKKKISEFTLYGDYGEKLIFVKKRIKHNLETDSASHFLQSLTRGKMELMVLRRAVEDDEPGILINADIYFVCHGSRFYQIKLKKRDLLKLPFVSRKEMKQLLLKEGIDVKEETGMIRAISSYNTALPDTGSQAH